MSTKNLNKNETKHKATHKRTQYNVKKLHLSSLKYQRHAFALIITHVQMSRKNLKEFCFIQILTFC